MSNNKYLIAFDLDGTLLEDENKTILPKTKELLIRLSKEGHKIILATGRPYRSMRKYYEELGLDTPIISFAGAHVFSLHDKNFPEIKLSMDKKDAIEMVTRLKKTGYFTNFIMENDKEIYADKGDPYVSKIFDLYNHGTIWRDINKIKNGPISILMFTKDNTHTEEIRKIVTSYKDMGVRFWWNALVPEPYNLKCSKGKAIELIASYYDIPMKNVIAFGDGYNDLEMLKVAEYGVVMVNAEEDVKTHAKYVTEFDNNHEGIYYELIKILKL